MSNGTIDLANFEFLSFASIKTALLILSEKDNLKKFVMFQSALHSVQSSFNKRRKL